MSWFLMILGNPLVQTMIMKGVLFLFGLATTGGAVPTGIEHGGPVVGSALMATAIAIPSNTVEKLRKK